MQGKEYKMSFFDSITFYDNGIKLKSQKNKLFSYSKIYSLKNLKKLAMIDLSLDIGLSVKKKCTISFKNSEREEMEQLFQYIKDRISIANEETIKVMKEEQEQLSKEKRMKCRVCGKIFCYTGYDIEKNKQNEKAVANATLSASLGAIGSIGTGLFGNRYDMYELNKMTDNSSTKADLIKNKIIDYTKCPSCGSKDLVDISEENITDKKNVDIASEIKKYKDLLDSGAITQEEYDQKKKELLK